MVICYTVPLNELTYFPNLMPEEIFVPIRVYDAQGLVFWPRIYNRSTWDLKLNKYLLVLLTSILMYANK